MIINELMIGISGDYYKVLWASISLENDNFLLFLATLLLVLLMFFVVINQLGNRCYSDATEKVYILYRV